MVTISPQSNGALEQEFGIDTLDSLLFSYRFTCTLKLISGASCYQEIQPRDGIS